MTAAGSGSCEANRWVARARRLSARARAACSQPRTVPWGRPTRRAIGRCPSPSAARRSASPFTYAPSRRRGTDHEDKSTCVVSHAAQRHRRGLTDWTSARSRTSRVRAKPHGDNRPEQAGHADSPAANAASTRSCVIAIESIEDLCSLTTAEPSHSASRPGRGGSCGTPTTVTPAPACRRCGAVPTVNGTEVPFHAQIRTYRWSRRGGRPWSGRPRPSHHGLRVCPALSS
jgi:hypothetical protein